MANTWALWVRSVIHASAVNTELDGSRLAQLERAVAVLRTVDAIRSSHHFHKPTSGLNSHQAAIVRPEGCNWLNHEGEVAIVIGRTARNIAPAETGGYIAGYTVANDYGLHDFRDTDAGSMLRVKGVSSPTSQVTSGAPGPSADAHVLPGPAGILPASAAECLPP